MEEDRAAFLLESYHEGEIRAEGHAEASRGVGRLREEIPAEPREVACLEGASLVVVLL